MNATPKVYGFTPNEVFVAEDLSLVIKPCKLNHPNPIELASRRMRDICFNIEFYAPRMNRVARTRQKFEYDCKGFVHMWCDGAVSANGREDSVSAIAVWFSHNFLLNWCKIVRSTLTNNQAEIFAVIRSLEICKSAGVECVIVHSDSAYIVDLINEGLLSDDSRLETYKNKEWLSTLKNVFNSYLKDSVKLLHVPGHTVDYGNLEADFFATVLIKEYHMLEELLNTFPPGEVLACIRLYVIYYQEIHKIMTNHHELVSVSTSTIFGKDDIVTITTHVLSQAYYGLSKKFFKRYSGEYKVVKKMGPNAYLVESIDGDGEPFVINVRRMQLLRRAV